MPDAACAYAETRTLVARKLTLIEQKMADLAAMHQVLGD
jgi:MerR family transcriptional regulator, mercuric resistance operon regulatory protein